MGQNMNVFPQNVTVPAKGFADISFGGATPNYWRVHNPGDASIYFGIRSLPSKTWYDFKVGAGQSRMYCEQYGISKFTCYNDSTNEVTILIQSFNAEYSNEVLAFSDYNLSGDQEIPVVIDGLSLYFQRQTYIYNVIPVLVNGNLAAGIEAFYPEPVNSGTRVKRICLLSNDGNNDLYLSINGVDMIVKPGEVLSDVNMYIIAFKIGSTLGTTYRLLYEVVPFI